MYIIIKITIIKILIIIKKNNNNNNNNKKKNNMCVRTCILILHIYMPLRLKVIPKKRTETRRLNPPRGRYSCKGSITRRDMHLNLEAGTCNEAAASDGLDVIGW